MGKREEQFAKKKSSYLSFRKMIKGKRTTRFEDK